MTILPTRGDDFLIPHVSQSTKRLQPLGDRTRGCQPVAFSVSVLGLGPFVGVTLEGEEHRFLLADYLVVHNCEEYGRMLTADPSKVCSYVSCLSRLCHVHHTPAAVPLTLGFLSLLLLLLRLVGTL